MCAIQVVSPRPGGPPRRYIHFLARVLSVSPSWANARGNCNLPFCHLPFFSLPSSSSDRQHARPPLCPALSCPVLPWLASCQQSKAQHKHKHSASESTSGSCRLHLTACRPELGRGLLLVCSRPPPPPRPPPPTATKTHPHLHPHPRRPASSALPQPQPRLASWPGSRPRPRSLRLCWPLSSLPCLGLLTLCRGGPIRPALDCTSPDSHLIL
ncbi:hypothetical protein BD289DRAFT_104698 [Coniella lustricola]|uniref:Uncharacterized protein n=1 Tax=Coniella lustricola TaxID=2025994 RepID=A0A2T2ZXU7_9PEZI|nr:hypothetical protein BD289DRAFT_104698 [Coniella lustricola]